MRKPLVLTTLLFLHTIAFCQIDPHVGRQTAGAGAAADTVYVLRPDRVFDGEQMHEGWVVVVHGPVIQQAGPASAVKLPSGAVSLELKGATILPGLIEGHSHLFLHPYNEVSWNDQVLKESRAERTARATVHARKTLLAGFTTTRDLGTEGAMYDDVGLKQAIEKGVIPGPHILAATRAIVATGSYGPKELSYDYESPHGAAEADGVEGLTREIRTQIGK
ncbi:MAG TPA: amidohydrolase family protein, partial [Puia sp.]|nr:amidohydrolase family protein [Puia sp.]